MSRPVGSTSRDGKGPGKGRKLCPNDACRAVLTSAAKVCWQCRERILTATEKAQALTSTRLAVGNVPTRRRNFVRPLEGAPARHSSHLLNEEEPCEQELPYVPVEEAFYSQNHHHNCHTSSNFEEGEPSRQAVYASAPCSAAQSPASGDVVFYNASYHNYGFCSSGGGTARRWSTEPPVAAPEATAAALGRWVGGSDRNLDGDFVGCSELPARAPAWGYAQSQSAYSSRSSSSSCGSSSGGVLKRELSLSGSSRASTALGSTSSSFDSWVSDGMEQEEEEGDAFHDVDAARLLFLKFGTELVKEGGR